MALLFTMSVKMPRDALDAPRASGGMATQVLMFTARGGMRAFLNLAHAAVHRAQSVSSSHHHRPIGGTGTRHASP